MSGMRKLFVGAGMRGQHFKEKSDDLGDGGIALGGPHAGDAIGFVGYGDGDVFHFLLLLLARESAELGAFGTDFGGFSQEFDAVRAT